MPFVTKVNLQDNRQHKLPPRESQILSGTTEFGVVFSALTTGPDPSDSGVTSTVINVYSTFSGNTGTTVFTFGDSKMSLAQNSFSAITSANSAQTQSSGYVWTGNTSQTVDGNLSYLDYTGTSFDIQVSSITETMAGVFTGTVFSTDVFYLSAGTLDFTGRTIWSDVKGIHRTEKLIVSEGAVAGYVLTSDGEGMATWQPSSGATGGTSGFWDETGTTNNSLVDIKGNHTVDSTGTTAYGIIGGGQTNTINGSDWSAVIGGRNNQINTTHRGIITGGRMNNMYRVGSSTISNGYLNEMTRYNVGDVSRYNFMGSGSLNKMREETKYSMMGSGTNNVMYECHSGVIGAGYNGYMRAHFSTILNGYDNTISGAGHSIIGAGYNNTITGSTLDRYNTLLNGTNNIITDANASSILGGTGNTVTNNFAVVVGGVNNTASGVGSHAEGLSTSATTTAAHAEGSTTLASGTYSHAEGLNTIASGGSGSHAEGSGCVASGSSAHAEGNGSIAGGLNSHAENESTATGQYSHSEGRDTLASGNYSHAQGRDTVASAYAAHAEGDSTTASGSTSHAEGQSTIAGGDHSHAQGESTEASGDHSHAGGQGRVAGTHVVVASGRGAFVHQVQSIATSGYIGARADYSAVLGGQDNDIGTGATNSAIFGGDLNIIQDNVTGSVILGGSGITGDTSDMVYVPDLVIDGLTSTDPLATDVNGKIIAGASDARLKKNVESIYDGLEKIKALRGVSYEWTEESNMGEGLRYGLIAQEVQEVIPEMVRERAKGDGMLTLNYNEVVPWLVEAIKDMSSDTYVNTILETQTITAEDNYIELNYNGNHKTALGGGIVVKNGIRDDADSFIKIDENGRWVVGPALTTSQLTIPEYTPDSSMDDIGSSGDIVWDDMYIYIKTNYGWRRTKLESF